MINQTASQMLNSTLDLKVGGTADNILMVEAGANELPEDDVLEALKLAHEAMQPVIELIKTMQAEVGKTKVTDFPVFLPPAEVKALVADMTADKVAALAAQSPDKTGWNDGLDAIKKDLLADLADRLASNEIQERDVADGMDAVVKNAVRRRILDTGIRPDGRDTLTVRPISVQVGKLPMVHGSGLFQRGETQVLTVATLGTPGDAQRLDGLQPGSEKRYIHHYNFPPFSTGEAYPMRGPKRREIGHGALAERALIPVLPENYPYTLRLVSEALSSNGSTAWPRSVAAPSP